MTVQQIGARMRKLEQQVAVLRRGFVHTTRKFPLKTNERARLATIWEEAAKILKNKLPKDSVAWQRKIRKEWDAR